MEFWGVEVKAGEPFKLAIKKGKCLHITQASLGEVKKDKGHESVSLFVKTKGTKLVIATLTPEKLPQQLLDLIFTTGTEFTHNGENGSVYLLGYMRDEDVEYEDEDSSDSEDEPLTTISGIPSAQVKEEKPAAAVITKELAANQKKVKIVEPSKDVEADYDDEDSGEEEDSMSTDGSSEDDEATKGGSDEDDSKGGSNEDDDDDSDEDDDSEEEDEKTPPQVQPGSKRRPAESAKTPVTDKKAKLVTSQKTDVKKGNVHVATPHPLKHAGKNPANKPNQQTPKAEGSYSCKPCNRSFKTESALDSHNKAKHTGK